MNHSNWNLKNFSKTEAILENGVSLTIQYAKGEDQVEINGRMPNILCVLEERTACPEDLPKTQDLRVAELPFE